MKAEQPPATPGRTLPWQPEPHRTPRLARIMAPTRFVSGPLYRAGLPIVSWLAVAISCFFGGPTCQAGSKTYPRPSAPCAGGMCPNGSYQNNGWGNGYQSEPGRSGPKNNAANTTGANNGITTATQTGNGQITGTGQALTPGQNPVNQTTATNNGQTSPTPSSGSNGVANTPSAQGSPPATTTAAARATNAPARGVSGFRTR